MTRILLIGAILLMLAVPAAAQVNTWWAVFAGDPVQTQLMILLGPYPSRLACQADLAEAARQRLLEPLTRSRCAPAVEIARMMLAP